MWIFTKYGFYSIVKKDDGVQVRARSLGDLARLCNELDRSLNTIIETVDADYRFRIVITTVAEIATLFELFADSIDYPNFKTEIALQPEQSDRLGEYSRIWAIMSAFQSRLYDNALPADYNVGMTFLDGDFDEDPYSPAEDVDADTPADEETGIAEADFNQS